MKSFTDTEQSVSSGRPSFNDPDIEEKLFGRNALEIDIPYWHTRGSSTDRPAVTRKRKVLSVEEESVLFLRYDYARHKLDSIEEEKKQRSTRKLRREAAKWRTRVRQIRSDLVSANMPLVVEMAKRSKVPNVEFADMISEGSMALLRAIDKFDLSRGFKFSTYACRAIQHGFNRMATRTGKYRDRYVIGLNPYLEENDRDDQVSEIRQLRAVDELQDILERNRADLTDTEKLVISERFGLQTGTPKTLAEVGKMIDRSIERARQAQLSALKKLREAFG
jgi:RNA polymerase sigma factor (sigma-70 family)